ncbi:MAG: AAA family ATPase [Candidatus Doudnabacteria bacterium]|nr:AAA family ATPase [Candidatus Doudnabacteria bacterium]
MFTGIYGHQKQIALLTKSMQSGKIAHAFLFTGPSFVGKHEVAKIFARTLLEHSRNDFHPDLLELSEEPIKIEQIRDLAYKLALRPYQAKYKVAIIDNADSMTIEAQNALLKILEEPKIYTILILVTSNPGKLLRTISSRTQKINFGLVPPEEYQKLLSENPEDEQTLLTLSAGRPGLARRITADPELVEKIKGIESSFNIIQTQDISEKLKLAYDLADLETADLKQVLDFWLMGYEQLLNQKPTLANAKNIVQINLSRKFLDQNVNSKLLLTNLMLNLQT